MIKNKMDLENDVRFQIKIKADKQNLATIYEL